MMIRVKGSKIWNISSQSKWIRPEGFMSFSQLTVLENCPKKWILSNATYPEIWEKRGYPQPISQASIQGTVVHKTLEVIVKGLAKNNCSSVDSEDAVETIKSIGGYKAVILNCIDEVLNGYIGNPRAEPFIDQVRNSLTSNIPELRRKVQCLISRIKLYSRTAASLKNSGLRYPLTQGAYSEIELKHQELQWRGIVDLLTLKPTHCEIRDFKTGAQKEEDKTQLHIYSLLWWRDVERNPNGRLAGKLVLSYASDGDIEVPTFEENELLDLECELKVRTERALDMVSAPVPEARTNIENCQYCGVRHLCEDYWDGEAHQIPIHKSKKGFLFGDLQVRLTDRMGESSWSGIVEKGPPSLIDKPIHLKISNEFSDLIVGCRVRLLGVQLLLSDQESGHEQPNAMIVNMTKSNELFILPGTTQE
jgi:hypothetical protein